MIPSSYPKDSSPGEREVFRRLQNESESKDWIVLHSLEIARHVKNISGEADFVILVPGEGILVLEVKSHKRIVVNEEGWTLGSDPIDRRGPFKQAAEAMHSIRKNLTDKNDIFGNIVTWSAACFTAHTFRDKNNFRITSSEWHDWQAIDRETIHRGSFSSIVLTLLRRGREWMLNCEHPIGCARNQDKYCSRDICEQAVQILRPRFELIMSPNAIRDQSDEEMLQLTEEQYDALDRVAANQRIVFEGAAGTGKTFLALEGYRRAKAMHNSEKIGLFCYNKLLGNHLAKILGEENEVGHLDLWLSKLVGDKVTSVDRSKKDFFSTILPRKALDILLGTDEDPPFDFLILDEAQDLLKPRYVDLLDVMVKGGLAGGRWMMFGDFENQDIFERDLYSGNENDYCLNTFITKRCGGVARYKLTVNCRNTPDVATYIRDLGGLDPNYSKVLRNSAPPSPTIKYYKNIDEQVNEVIKYIKSIKDLKFKNTDIVILSPKKDSIAKKMQQIPEYRNALSPYPANLEEGKIGYATIQSFKGLEAPVVLLTDLDDPGLGDTLPLDEVRRSIFYVGISRAVHALGLFIPSSLKSQIIDL
jgi:hypothetical protein